MPYIRFRTRQLTTTVNESADEESKPKGKKRRPGRRKAVSQLARSQGVHGSVYADRERNVALSSNKPSLYHQSELPPWFPSPYGVAVAVTEVIDLGIDRQVKLGLDDAFPVPKTVSLAARGFRVPRTSYFANSWFQGYEKNTPPDVLERQREQRTSRALFTLAQIWPYVTRKIETSDMRERDGLTSANWREVFKRRVQDKEIDAVMEKLGLMVAFAGDTDALVYDRDWKKNAGAINDTQGVQSPWKLLMDRLGDTTTWAGHELPAWTWNATNWASDEWRRWMMWSVGELEFRHELLSFDLVLRQCFPDIPQYRDNTPQNRFGEITQCWGGGGIVPTHEENWLCSSDAQKQLDAIIALRELMRAWPRSQDLLPTWSETEGAREGDGSLAGTRVNDLSEINRETLEREAWTCFVQTYFDYRHSFPPLPFSQPACPFVRE